MAADPDETSMVTPAPPADPDKTSLVTPFSTGAPETGTPHVNPHAAPPVTPQWQPSAAPTPQTTPVPPSPQPTNWTPAPPQWTPPPTAPVPPAPPANYGPQYGAPQYGAPQPPQGPGVQQQWPGAPGPQHPGAGFGAPQPQSGLVYPFGPYPGAAQPNPGPAAPGFPSPAAPQSPGELASNLIGKGNTFLTRLMQRGMQGELIKAPWFQAFRQSPDQFMLISYIVVAVLVLLLSYGGGLIGSVLSLAFWAGLAYTFFAIGTLKAHKWVANGIGYGGAAIALVGTIDPITALIDFSEYAPTSLGLRLGVNIAISVIVAAVLGLAGYLVNKEIKRLTTNPF